MSKRKWIDIPTAVLIETKVGAMSVTCTGQNAIYVGFGRTGFEAPLAVVREVRYYGSHHFRVDGDEVKAYNPGYHFKAKRVRDFADASDAANKAIYEAMKGAAREFVAKHPDLVLAGNMADLNNEIMRAEESLEKARQQVDTSRVVLLLLKEKEEGLKR